MACSITWQKILDIFIPVVFPKVLRGAKKQPKKTFRKVEISKFIFLDSSDDSVSTISEFENLGNSKNDRTESWIQECVSDQVSNIQISLPDLITGFYGVKEFVFQTCGMDGMYGPDLAKCISFYNVNWVKNSDYFSIPKRGIQKVKIPISTEFEFTAFGAGWMNYGAMAKANIKLENGTEIYIGIGQQGNDTGDGCGGTFAAIRENGKFIPIIIAGGAGGGYWENEDGNGSMDQFGNRSDYIHERNTNIGIEGKSGTYYYNGGNGFFGRIKGNWKWTEDPPKSFEDGLNGGRRHNEDHIINKGGFGGGGNGRYGGGGGYTGGHGGKTPFFIGGTKLLYKM